MFREDKTTQMAAAFLKLTGSRMKYIHLIKLMYIADKRMVIDRDLPITFDKWVSMPKGPVLSITLDLIKGVDSRRYTSSGYWGSHIATVGRDAVLKSDPGDLDLSRSEDRVIAETFAEFGTQDTWRLVDETHQFPEWTNPESRGKKSIPIDYGDAVMLNGGTAEKVKALRRNLEEQQYLREMAAPV